MMGEPLSYEKFVVRVSEFNVGQDVDGGENFILFNEEKHEFRTLEDAAVWIVERYSRVELLNGDASWDERGVFQDAKDGVTYRVGTLYRYRNRDWSHASEEWTQEDAVYVERVVTFPVCEVKLDG